MRPIRPVGAARWLLLFALLAAAAREAPAEEVTAASDAELRAQLEELIRQNRAMQGQIEALQRGMQEVRDEARAAHEIAAQPLPNANAGRAASSESGAATPGSGALFSYPVGRANLQLLDISLDTLVAGGWSSEKDGALRDLQGGDHDPRQRGFTLQGVELFMAGAVDPYLQGQLSLSYFIDSDGESQFELEEAYATTQMLPFGLEEHGLQLEAGQFFTEYGRINPRHPHAWDWQDQPVINTRLFGPDGIRQTGMRVGWLTPLPWFSELHLGVQNGKGETMASFLANQEVFEERPVGGRPFDAPSVGDPADLVYLVRWVNGDDFGDEWSAQWGVSGLFGPNATGDDARTYVAGSDLVLKWRSLSASHGAPSLTWQTEFSYRWYETGDFLGCPELAAGERCGVDVAPAALGGTTLDDWGLYTQLLWGFRPRWSAGVRYGYASASGSDVGFDAGTNSFVSVSRNDDPFRDDRHRVSPLLSYRPTDFSRLRLQYNYDHARHLDGNDAHTMWLGLEFLFGAHAAHAY